MVTRCGARWWSNQRLGSRLRARAHAIRCFSAHWCVYWWTTEEGGLYLAATTVPYSFMNLKVKVSLSTLNMSSQAPQEEALHNDRKESEKEMLFSRQNQLQRGATL